MRSPVHRNLDKPVQLFGFYIGELLVLVLFFVIGGEISDFTGISRGWSFFVTLILAAGFFCFRKAMGDLFARRLLRFVSLPQELQRRLIVKDFCHVDS
jgi:hypothetical protein